MFVVAANLSNLGNLISNCSNNTAEEIAFLLAESIDEIPENVFNEVANIVGCIPRLEIVASMVEKAVAFPKRDDHWRNWPLDILGGHLLAIVSGVESRLEEGSSEYKSLLDMLKQGESVKFNSQLLQDFAQANFKIDLFKADIMPQDDSEENKIGLMELKSDLILTENLVTILSKGTKLTQNLCVLIQKCHQTMPLVFPIKVFSED